MAQVSLAATPLKDSLGQINHGPVTALATEHRIGSRMAFCSSPPTYYQLGHFCER